MRRAALPVVPIHLEAGREDVDLIWRYTNNFAVRIRCTAPSYADARRLARGERPMLMLSNVLRLVPIILQAMVAVQETFGKPDYHGNALSPDLRQQSKKAHALGISRDIYAMIEGQVGADVINDPIIALSMSRVIDAIKGLERDMQAVRVKKLNPPIDVDSGDMTIDEPLDPR